MSGLRAMARKTVDLADGWIWAVCMSADVWFHGESKISCSAGKAPGQVVVGSAHASLEIMLLENPNSNFTRKCLGYI